MGKEENGYWEQRAVSAAGKFYGNAQPSAQFIASESELLISSNNNQKEQMETCVTFALCWGCHLNPGAAQRSLPLLHVEQKHRCGIKRFKFLRQSICLSGHSPLFIGWK